jgi:hypothetical protein
VQAALPSGANLETVRKEILAEVIAVVRATNHPVPLEALADRAVRNIGYDKTVGSAWGGVGGFRDLLAKGLPEDIRLNDQPPYYVYDATRAAQRETRRVETRMESRTPEPLRQEAAAAPMQRSLPPLLGATQPAQRPVAPPPGPPAQAPRGPLAPAQSEALSGQPGLPRSQPLPPPRPGDATAIQQSIARIHEASQAPTLSPPDYRALFDVMAQEITANGLTGSQTLVNIVKRAQDSGVDVRRDDARFVLDVVSEADPWFDQGVSAGLFASRFRNFVVARCRSQGLSLSADELDLIEAWFAGPTVPQRAPAPQAPAYGSAQGQAYAPAPPQAAPPQAAQPPAPAQNNELRADRWWSLEDGRQTAADQGNPPNDEFPRIIRTRLRG